MPTALHMQDAIMPMLSRQWVKEILASERALRNFTIGRKNWVTINTVRGAQASTIIYNITETALANNMNVYYYIKHLLTELPQLIDKELETLSPWNDNVKKLCEK